MIIGITGSPGTGKTTVAKELAKKIKAIHINEGEFAVNEKIASFNVEENELELPLGKLREHLNKFIKENKDKNVIIEGHVICETKINVDKMFVLKVHPEILEERLSIKGYNDVKIQDNVFCEGIDYCLKKAKKNYKKVVIIKNEGPLNNIIQKIILEME